MHNIEKSAFNKGEYVGYGGGVVWRIRRAHSSFGKWCARPLEYTCGNNDKLKNTIVYAFRLRDMSDKLHVVSEA
jgi:hypothetical protein